MYPIEESETNGLPLKFPFIFSRCKYHYTNIIQPTDRAALFKCVISVSWQQRYKLMNAGKRRVYNNNKTKRIPEAFYSRIFYN